MQFFLYNISYTREP